MPFTDCGTILSLELENIFNLNKNSQHEKALT